MNIVEIINKKRLNKELTYEEINYVIDNFTNDNIQDEEIKSLLFSFNLNGVTDNELIYLTDSLLKLENKVDLSNIDGLKLDSYSTSFLEDKTEFILLSLLASTGMIIFKPNDELQKLTSINGLNIIKNTNITRDKLKSLINFEDTIQTLPLIAALIMSKKINNGPDIIIIDIKVGQDTLIKDFKSAKELANLIIKISKYYNKKTICIVNSMNEPIGNNIGNNLEVLEIIEILKNNGPVDLKEYILNIGSKIISTINNITIEQAKDKLKNNLENGKAYQKFLELVENHDDINVSNKVFSIKSNKTGFVSKIKIRKLEEIIKTISKDNTDNEVGIVLNKKIGDYILQDEELLKVYLNDIDISINEILNCFEIEQTSKKKDFIFEIVE